MNVKSSFSFIIRREKFKLVTSASCENKDIREFDHVS